MARTSAASSKSAASAKSAKSGAGERGRPAFPWLWLLPNLALLAGMAAWGVAVYPRLPARVPQHMGPDGVDAYTAKSVGAVFVPVFVHAGTVLLLAVVAAAVVRMRPESEFPAESGAGTGAGAGGRVTYGPWQGSWARQAVNRPATREGARRIARATLFLALCEGAALAAACTVMWRTGPADSAVPGWVTWAVLLPTLLGVVPLLVVAFLDRRSARRSGGVRAAG